MKLIAAELIFTALRGGKGREKRERERSGEGR